MIGLTNALTLATEATGKVVPGGDINVPLWGWGAFIALIAFLLLLDLKVFHRESHEIHPAEALKFSIFWISLGLLFTFVIWGTLGGSAASQYITGYLIEKSLSIDNVFVWAVIFTYFGVPSKYQHRTLFWGIFGALVLRAIFIFAGVALLEAFDWIIFVFGGFLIITAWRIAHHDEGEVHPERNPVLKLVRRFVPSTSEYVGDHFFVKQAGKRLATPLFAVLVMVEATDVIFAVDSIPAILAVTHSQFLVFSSNAFAILGLRALYFLLAGYQGRFIYLNQGLGVILGYVGVKMIIAEWYHIPTFVSLAVIIVVLTATILISLKVSARQEAESDATAAPEPDSIPPSGRPDED
ncbi:MAG: TerC family protein [Acidimicrobiia bacterium]|nr:TerC family protein [Acidimicrobiia bacterium]